MRRIRIARTPARDIQHLLRDLNDAQRAAVSAPDGKHLVLAGPGSGKTRVVTHRVVWLLARGERPESILLATFTRRAANEMTRRLAALAGESARRVFTGTFHQLANRILREPAFAKTLAINPSFTILDPDDALEILRAALRNLQIQNENRNPADQPDEPALKPATLQNLLSKSVNTLKPLHQLLHDDAPALLPRLEFLRQARQAFLERKRAANALDYDDLLVAWRALLKDHPSARQALGARFKHLLVDETQDTNALQIDILERLADAGPGNLLAVGDDAQSIYRFRGANYENILQFPQRHPSASIHKLEINYRSTPQIVALVNHSIRNNETGFPKTIQAVRPDGTLPLVVPAADPAEEAEIVCSLILEQLEAGVPPREIAVLYRNHHDSVVLQGELVARGIPYEIRSGLRFFEQAHVKDALAYLRIFANPRDEIAWRRILTLQPGIGDARASKILERILPQPQPLEALQTADTMNLVPPRGRGAFAAFVADLRAVDRADPHRKPAEALAAVLAGGFPRTIRDRFENPELRIKDLEQLAILANRYQSLQAFVSELVLAGDLYGADALRQARPDQDHDPDDDQHDQHVTLSTVHQAKGLEWSRVHVIRLLEDAFPHIRAQAEPDGIEEERRVFYVATSRAKDELILTYPLLHHPKTPRAPVTIAKPSRFLEELPPTLYESGIIDPQ